ncbi:hypothetical protein ANANG_G00062040 [Anguilla anguilla]|uniref:NACHT domain-containing protein n=1 Tax=Anguilla anguilla TaxID=7936 RepID=A0A9D3S2N2_ANGAN|nr:hypothetical protein ANANG_G00062040 [Anguilla anguilla]
MAYHFTTPISGVYASTVDSEKLRSPAARPGGTVQDGRRTASRPAPPREAMSGGGAAGRPRAGLAPRCLASHFCRREDERSVEVWRFVLGLVEQLRGSPLLPPGYAQTLDTPAVALTLDPLHCQRDPDDTFRRAVLLPLQETPPPAHRLFLLVDSLDSGFQGGGVGEGRSGSIAELLSRHHHLFPSWLLLICSVRRQNRAAYRMFSGFRKLVLDDLRKAPVVHDVQQYILRRLDQEGALRRHLTPETAEMLNLLHIKSGGCFLFLERVLDGVSRGLLAVREIRHIPGTLNGLYLWLCQRLFPKGLFSEARPLLNVLLAAPRPLSPELLYRAVWTRDPALGPAQFRRRLDAPFAAPDGGEEQGGGGGGGGGGTLSLFHASFAEWLLDVKYCTQRYLCSLEDGHALLAMSLTLRAAQLATPDICQLANHLLRSGMHASDPALLALWMVWTGVPAVGGATPRPPSRRGGRGGAPAVAGRTPLADHQGQTPLTLAAREGHLGAARSAGLGGGDGGRGGRGGHAGARRQRGLDAAAAGGLGRARRGGAPPAGRRRRRGTAATRTGRTALRAAAWAGHLEIVLALLEHGARPDRADREGRTPLIAAAYMGHREALEALLAHGRGWTRRTPTGGPPCASPPCACRRRPGAGPRRGGERAPGPGADPSHRDKDGMTPLLLAAYEARRP